MKKYKKFDIFAYNPSYEWTAYKTGVGSVMSYLTVGFLIFYIAITTRDYIFRPPELVSQGDIDLLAVAREIPFQIPRIGLRLSYNAPNGTRTVIGTDNQDPYFSYQLSHVTVTDQDRIPREVKVLEAEECVVSNLQSLCPVGTSEFDLQGTFFKETYKFVQFQAFKCIGSPWCAPLDEIDFKIQSGDFRAQVGIEAEQFDVELFHNTGLGAAMSNRSWEWYGIPNIELNTDIFLQPREIGKEDRYLGSPPIPEKTVRILSFARRETNLRPRSSLEPDLLSWNIRLSDSVLLQEVSYWSPSILDLFGLWGAMTSFLVSLSLGFIAFNYNRFHFHRYFEKAAKQKRIDAQRMTLTSMELISRKSNGGADLYDNLRSQYDSLMIEPDIRLFEDHHFNSDGRVSVTSEELKYPTTAFGELRRIAMESHMQKKRAARVLCLWWGHILVKRGFIKDDKRKRELFASVYASAQKLSSRRHLESGTKVDDRRGNPPLQWLRRRMNRTMHSTSGRLETNDDEQRVDALTAMEEGKSYSLPLNDKPCQPVARSINFERLPSSRSLREDGEVLQRPEKMRAMISELDLMSPK